MPLDDIRQCRDAAIAALDARYADLIPAPDEVLSYRRRGFLCQPADFRV
jgi:hypothetical protein